MAVPYAGGTYVNATYIGDTRWSIMKAFRDNLVSAGWTNVALGAGQGPGNAGTVTITIASPGVVTFTGHGFLGGERVILATTGALPSGLSVNTIYFVKFIDANTFNLSTTLGGSNINTSGSQSGTQTLYTESMLLQSATQSGVTNPVRMRIKDYLGVCAAIQVESFSGGQAGIINSGAGGFILPVAAQTNRIIATKYWFYCLTPTTVVARSFVMGGMPYVDPTILTGITDIGYMFSNAQFDGDTATRNSIRIASAINSGTGAPNYTVLLNTSLWSNNNNNNGYATNAPGYPDNIFMAPPQSSGGNVKNYRWGNDAFLTSDVLVSWGTSSGTDEAKIRGQFYDMIYISESVTMDTTDTFNGHTWYNITHNGPVSNSYPRGGMWVRIDT